MASTSTASKTFGRKLGYCISAVINTVIFYLVNVSPGWRAVPFLTEKTTEIIPLINLSLIVGIVVNLVYLAYDPPSLRALGEVVTTGITLTILFRILNVFPFDTTVFPFDTSDRWDDGLHVLLVFCIIFALIALIIQSVRLIRALLGTNG